MSKQETSEFDVDKYHPKSPDETEFVPSPLPPRDFFPGMFANYQPALFPNGLVVINLVHKQYPDAVCQIQLFPSPEGVHTFFCHMSPSKKYIPDVLAEEIGVPIIGVVLEQVEAMFPNGPVQ